MKEAFGLSVPQTLREVVVPSRCGLIVYDMQAGIVPQIQTGPDVLKQCVSLLEAARTAGFRIFHTRHFFLPRSAAGVGQIAARHGVAAQRRATGDEVLYPAGLTWIPHRY